MADRFRRNYINAENIYALPAFDYEDYFGYSDARQENINRNAHQREPREPIASEQTSRHVRKSQEYKRDQKEPNMDWRTLALSSNFCQPGWRKNLDPYFASMDFDSSDEPIRSKTINITHQSKKEGKPWLKILILSILLLVIIAVPTVVVVILKQGDNKDTIVDDVKVKMELTLDKVFTKTLEDETSDEYKTLAGGIHPALIAAIASRESRAGRLLQTTNGYGDNGNFYGILQCDVNACPVCPNYSCTTFTWNSCEHIIMMTTNVVVPYIKQVQTQHPTWTPEQQMQGGVAAYNVGVSRVQSWLNFDVGTTDGDYSNDVMARAQYLVNKKIW